MSTLGPWRSIIYLDIPKHSQISSMKMLARNHRITPSKRNILGVYQSPPTERHRNKGQIWGGLNKAWLGYVIAKSQKKDYEKMRSILSSKNSKTREYRNN